MVSLQIMTRWFDQGTPQTATPIYMLLLCLRLNLIRASNAALAGDQQWLLVASHDSELDCDRPASSSTWWLLSREVVAKLYTDAEIASADVAQRAETVLDPIRLQ